ncbi:hypothetical protein Hanom_Chr01g00050961 [Helianthus anomalus]
MLLAFWNKECKWAKGLHNIIYGLECLKDAFAIPVLVLSIQH